MELMAEDYIDHSPANARSNKDAVAILKIVAFDSGFNSTDGYTRAFSKEFGCTPKEYAKSPKPIILLIVVK